MCLFRACLALILVALLHLPLKAATLTWTGTTNNTWDTTTAANWGGTAWSNATPDDALFGATGVGTISIVASGITARNLTFNTTGYTIATNTLTLSGTTPTITTATGVTASISSVIAGSAGLVKAGAGTLTLSGSNTFTGGTTLSAGTLQWAAANALSTAGTVLLNDANTGTSNVSLLGTVAGTLARNITVQNLGSGIVTIGGVQASGAVVYSGTVTLNRAVTFNSPSTADRTDFSGNITGNVGTLTIAGGGRTIFVTTNSKTFIGDVVLSGNGTNLQIGVNSGALDQIPNTSSVNVGTGASLRLSASSEEFGGLNGSGTVNQNGTGGGVFIIGSQNASGSFSGAIGSGGTLFGITKIGTGTQTLSGAGTYTGITSVNGGTLTLAFGTVVSNILGSSSALTLGGGTLNLTGTGTQTVAGLTTTVSTSSRIVLAASETLTLGALTSAGAGSALNFNTTTGGANGATVGTGIITLTGQTAGSSIRPGYTVTDAGGTGFATVNGSNQIIRLTGSSLLPASGAVSTVDYQIDNNAGGAAAAGSSSLTLTASQSARTIAITNAATAGVLTLNSGVVLSNNGWVFGGTGASTYQITGGAGLTSVASGDAILFTNNQSSTVTISSPILASGTNNVSFNGTGTTALNGTSTYIGTTNVSGGTLQLGNGGTTGALNTASVISVASGATFAVNRSNSVIQGTDFRDAAISGAGNFAQIGSGTTSLVSANTYTGNTTVSAGTLRLGNGSTVGSLSTASAITVASGATFAVNRSNAVSQGTEFSGSAISGAGNFAQIGSGTTTLTAANTYSGSTSVNLGTLTLAFGSVASNIISSSSTLTLGGGTLNLTGTGTQTVNGLTTAVSTISRIILSANETLTLGALTSAGAGSSVNFNTSTGGANGASVGTGIITLTGTVAGTSISSGFTVTDAGGTGFATVNGSNQIIRLTGSTLLPASGSISTVDYQIDNNAGGVAAAGSSTLTLTASQTTRTITVTNAATSGVLTLNSGVVLSNNGWVFGDSGTGTYQITGSAGGAGLTSVLANNTMFFTNNQSGNVTLSSPILANGTNNVSFIGTGTTILNATNTYTGTTTLSGGTLQLGNGGTTGSLVSSNAITNNGSLIINRSNAVTHSGVISGTGTLTQAGSGTTTLSAVNTYTGGTTVNAGTLDLTIGGTSGAIRGALTINAGATVRVSIANGLGNAQGARIGALTLTSGTLDFQNTGNNSITSEFTTLTGSSITGMSGSKFDLRNNGIGSANVTTLASATTSIISVGTLGLPANNPTFTVASGTTVSGIDLQISSIIVNDAGTGGGGTGVGNVTKAGSGTLQLSAANTYTGTTTLTAGTLALTSTGTTGTGAVTAQTGSTILGTGTVRGSSFTAQSGSSIYAGNGTAQGDYGTLNFTPAASGGSLDFESGSAITLGINPSGTGDKLVFTGMTSGTLAFNGNLTINAPSGYTPTSVVSFDLLDWMSLSNTFASRFSAGSYSGYLLGNGDDNQGFDLPDISSSNYRWDISQFTTNGSISTVNVVPEPSRALLLFLGMMGLILRRVR